MTPPLAPPSDKVSNEVLGWVKQYQSLLGANGLTRLAPVWTGHEQWHVLDAVGGGMAGFLLAWNLWRQSAQRPARLFYTLVTTQAPDTAELTALAICDPELSPLTETLSPRLKGLLSGMHRFTLDGEAVQLTLCLGETPTVLQQLDASTDSVLLGSSGVWDAHDLKLLARLSRPGTRLAGLPSLGIDRHSLASLGFEMAQPSDTDDTGVWSGTYRPRWPTGKLERHQAEWSDGVERHAVVVGAGLAGSAAAHSLALRGWSVDVLDAGDHPASGASGLPAGVIAPHVSPDDSRLSRLSRCGVRLTLQRAARLLQVSQDWAPCGVLEHRVEGKRGLPATPDWQTAGQDWSLPANPGQLLAAGLDEQTPALWHAMGGWIRPAQLVRAQLQHPAIRWHGNTRVSRLEYRGARWHLLDADNRCLAQTGHVVLAAGYPTLALLRGLDADAALPLNPLRGQISWGPLSDLAPLARAALPPFPVNGHGSLVSGQPGPDPDKSPGWFVGSTFERGATEPDLKPADHEANRLKLERLLPRLTPDMAGPFAQARGWAGVRCTLPDRLPAVGPWAPDRFPGLMLCTGLGARGLTLSVLCGELLAAGLHGEPWPMEKKLAHALSVQRFSPS